MTYDQTVKGVKQRVPLEEEELKVKGVIPRVPLKEEELNVKGVIQRVPLEEEELLWYLRTFLRGIVFFSLNQSTCG